VAAPYKRIFLRWEILRGWVPALIFAAIAITIELFFFNYMVSLGLADKTVSAPVWPCPISIAMVLSLGNAVVLLTLWMSVFENTAYVKAGPDRQVRRALYPIRMIRVAALVLAPFTLVLFLPYILESGWFVSWAASASNTLPSTRGTAVSFYNWAYGIAQTDISTRFIASQLLAALAATVVSGLQLWRVRGTRNLMLLLRKKR